MSARIVLLLLATLATADVASGRSARRYVCEDGACLGGGVCLPNPMPCDFDGRADGVCTFFFHYPELGCSLACGSPPPDVTVLVRAGKRMRAKNVPGKPLLICRRQHDPRRYPRVASD